MEILLGTLVLPIVALVLLVCGSFFVAGRLGQIKGFLTTLLSSNFLRHGSKQNVADRMTVMAQDMLKATNTAAIGFILILVSFAFLLVAIGLK